MNCQLVVWKSEEMEGVRYVTVALAADPFCFCNSAELPEQSREDDALQTTNIYAQPINLSLYLLWACLTRC